MTKQKLKETVMKPRKIEKRPRTTKSKQILIERTLKKNEKKTKKSINPKNTNIAKKVRRRKAKIKKK